MPSVRTFPGIAFRVETPTTVDLPRMDIAAFVGFAQRGPLHLPVVVESYPDFVNLFGGLYPLAWDGEQRLWQTACLAPAVKAFFVQGGRRCWVVRVAGKAATTTGFPLGGLLQTMPLGGYSGVEALARCPGSWADNLQTRVDPLFTPLDFVSGAVQPGAALTLSVQTQGNVPLQAGEMLQIDVGDRRHRAYGIIPPLPPSARRGTATFPLSQVRWFHRLLPSQLPLAGNLHTVAPTATASTFGRLTLLSSAIEASLDEAFVTRATLALTLIDFWWRWYREIQNTQPLGAEVLDLWFLSLAYHLISGTPAVLPGDWLRLETESLSLWLLVETVTRTWELTVQVWAAGADPAVVPQPVSRVQQVRLALQVRPAEALQDDQPLTLANLAGAAPHPRFVGNLPDDAELFALTWGAPPTQMRSPTPVLWQSLKAPRFPLSLKLDATTMVIPLGLDTPLPWRSGSVPAGNALERDGLVPPTQDAVALTGKDWADFLPTLFLDPVLRFTEQRSLLTEVSDRFYLQNQSLQGMHALFPLEEVSLFALPDAAHSGWFLTTLDIIPPAPEPSPPKLPDPCATNSPFTPCVSLPNSPSNKTQPSPAVTPSLQWQLLPSHAYDAAGLLEIQLAAARLAAARSDWIAVLGLPKHYRPPNVQTHQRQLLEAVRREGDTTDSYLTMYHPWLIRREETGELLHTHPVGPMLGVMAARSLQRGAWVAPANEPLAEILGTLPKLATTDEQLLYSAGINPIRQLPQGFVAWGNFTQSVDPDLEDLNVRRLLILLRRLALQEGQSLVFSPHDDALERRVQQQFEQVLTRLFNQGAFAGRVPAEAYQVVVDRTLNPRNQIEQGRLMVELRVAPAQPMTFITVRLIQQDSDSLTVQEVRTNGG